MNLETIDALLRCSFCHKSQDAVGQLISSPTDHPRAHICDECISVCNAILEDNGRAILPHPVIAKYGQPVNLSTPQLTPVQLSPVQMSPVQMSPVQMSPVMTSLAHFAEFSVAKMAKTTIAHGESLYAGLNCFEPGQEHAAHAHPGQEKLYVVLQGDAEIQVGDEKKTLSAGGGAFASSGVMHSVKNVGETRLIVLAVLAPPPAAK